MGFPSSRDDPSGAAAAEAAYAAGAVRPPAGPGPVTVVTIALELGCDVPEGHAFVKRIGRIAVNSDTFVSMASTVTLRG